MIYKNIEIEIENEIAILSLNRPEKLNALSLELFLELKHFFEQDTTYRGLILRGAGDRAFAAGADIQQMSLMSPEQSERFAALAQQVTEKIEALPVPVIACVDGFALGGGCELALSCDFIYCTEKSVFGQPEVKLGLIPGFGGCVRLQRVIGVARAKELIFTGRRIRADEAFRIGLVNQVFLTKQEMMTEAQQILKQIFQNSLTAVSICKKVIGQQPGVSTSEGLAIELRGFRQAFDSPHRQIGIQAFLDKSMPKFEGDSKVAGIETEVPNLA